MICPHCEFENQDGRKYCRRCAKALAAAPAVVHPEAESLDPLPDAPLTENSSADESSVQAPIQHESSEESHTAKSLPAPSAPGVNKNLIAIVAVVVAAVGGAAYWFMHKGAHDSDTQASAQSPIANVAYHPDAASVRTREHVLAALRQIVAQQEARLADDPDDLNVCGVNVFGNDELGAHVRESHYIFDQQCQPQTPDGKAIRKGFTVTATPKVEGNAADAPAYCVDQTKIIRRYADTSAVTNATSVQHLTCPLDGQPLE